MLIQSLIPSQISTSIIQPRTSINKQTRILVTLIMLTVIAIFIIILLALHLKQLNRRIIIIIIAGQHLRMLRTSALLVLLSIKLILSKAVELAALVQVVVVSLEITARLSLCAWRQIPWKTLMLRVMMDLARRSLSKAIKYSSIA